ncbi:PQQ-dependent sugar dehydrogenase [Wenzhouxiangella sp. C33]|uniref:PQQ-dependent sugar dehydrogenase n=2 Tax=Wenzhouxiangella limi TaxID=2707351 RepID=A0A845V158_9GAMM|nr:PQQ-dependent sugar dehydrogenase [Wenzhouxiangella limi]
MPMRHVLSMFLVFGLTACNAGQQAAPDAGQSAEAAASSESRPARSPEETRPPEADYEPAFQGQTRAPKPAATEAWTTETVAQGLEHPWAIDFLPDGAMLVTERPGRLRVVSADGDISDPVSGVPAVDARRQGGLLDIALAPDFESSRTLYLSFSEPHEDGTNNTAVARARLSEDATALEEVEIIFSQYPSVESVGHYGSRIVFQDADTIWVTMGDRQGHPVRQNAQDPTNLIGTVARIHTDGSIPDDNPFIDHQENAPEMWSWGHRNIQAADVHPETGELWTVEHGPRGGDELNLTEAGKNYGWPAISYGIEYRGGEVYEGKTEQDGMEQPVYYWDPVIAPSGMSFYTGEVFPEWRGDLFVGGLRSALVSRLVLADGRVVAEEWLEVGHRVRDVVQGPDGYIYLVTDESDGRVMRIVPEG